MNDLTKVPDQTMLGVLERIIKDVTIPLERVERAKIMFDEARREEAKAAYDVALARAQSEMQSISRDMDNPQTRSKYASLAAVDRAIKPIYTKHGIAVSFNTRPSEKGGDWIDIVAEVHCAGHSEFKSLPMLADGIGAKGAPVMTRTHAMGSALTYGRRQLLKMIFNLAEADDDGNAAGKASEMLTADELEVIKQLLNDASAESSDVERFCVKMKVKGLEFLRRSQLKEAKDSIEFFKQGKADRAAKKP
jgi:hypothetical protein